MNDRVPINLIVITPKSLYGLGFLIGVAVTSAYYFGKKVQRMETEKS